MPKTILITGCSSGFGKLSAKLFADKGWNVIATMRNPSKDKELKKEPNIFVTKLDVTDSKTIKKAVKLSIDKFGKIDVLLNNAGFGLFGMLEDTNQTDIENCISTNLMGQIRVAKEVIPYMRKENNGMIINISSMLGFIGFPMGSIYSASKFGIEGFSESLQYELKEFNIKVKIIEPGNFNTNFGKNILFPKNNIKKDLAKKEIDYKKNAKKTLKNTPFIKQGEASKVVYKIWEIANSKNNKLRYVVGKDAKSINLTKKISKHLTYKIIEKIMIPKK